MSTPALIAVYEQREMGQVFHDPRGKLRFLYASSWRDSVNAFPLSHALPLAASEHRGSPVESFLWGLLPDQEQVLQRWARDFQVSPRNAFALLSVVGEDCAGAIRFLTGC